MQLDKSIIVIGQICSGKTTFAKLLSSDFDIPLASFGGFLKTRVHNNTDSKKGREVLQNLGQNLIDSDPRAFLQNVIQFAGSHQNFIFEGVRHEVIFREINDISAKVISIYIDATYQQRFDRYLKREKLKDTKRTEEEFSRVCAHQVELQIPSLKEKCSFIIDSSESQTDDYNKIKNYVRIGLRD